MSEGSDVHTPIHTQAESTHPRWRPGFRLTVAALAVGALLVGATGLGLALSAGATTPTAATPAGCNSSQPRLTVQGTGQAHGTPDVLTAVFGFSASAPSATAALSQNNADVNQVLLALSSKGVAQSDVQTTGLTLAPQYVYPKGVQTRTGFGATNTVTATLRNVKTAGDAIDAVVNAAGDAATINSLTFSFGNPAQVEDQARAHAVHQAVAHAAAMAEAAGRRLGPVCSLTDNTQPSLIQPFGGAGYAAATNQAAVPVEPGTQTESDQVTMVYALERR
ncbi:MAG TPA: SIMPL domain-containing protein [Acidimicrobiales bacterium]|jgi:hypothetical protein